MSVLNSEVSNFISYHFLLIMCVHFLQHLYYLQNDVKINTTLICAFIFEKKYVKRLNYNCDENRILGNIKKGEYDHADDDDDDDGSNNNE